MINDREKRDFFNLLDSFIKRKRNICAVEEYGLFIAGTDISKLIIEYIEDRDIPYKDYFEAIE